MANSAARFQFERAVAEYARWHAIDEHDRSQAPAWWWATAFALRSDPEEMPTPWATMMGLAPAASYAEAARVFLQSMEQQIFLPWPDDFPGRHSPQAATPVV
jgi:hypothetical protein